MYQLIVLKFGIKRVVDELFGIDVDQRNSFYLLCFEDFRYDDNFLLKNLLYDKICFFSKGNNSILKVKKLIANKFIIYLTDKVFFKNYNFYFLYFKSNLFFNYVNNLSKKYKKRLFSLKFVYLILYDNFFTYDYFFNFLIFINRIKKIININYIKIKIFFFFFFFFLYIFFFFFFFFFL